MKDRKDKILLEMIESTTDYIGTADLDGNLKYHNSSALKLLGLDESTDLSKLKISDMHPKWASQIILHEAIPQALKNGYWVGETALLHSQGYEIPVSQVLLVHRDDDGKAQYLSTIMRDNTEQKNMEKKLFDAYSAFAAQKDAIDKSAIVVETDPHGKITYANETFVCISKYDYEEVIGQDHRLLNSGFHPKGFFKDLWKTITSGQVWRGEIKNKAKDGTFYWVYTTIYPVVGKQGKIQKFIAIRFDISEQKKIIAEQEVLNKVLSQSRTLEQSLEKKLTDCLDHILTVPWLSLLNKGGVFLAQDEKLSLFVSRNLGEKIETMCSEVKKGQCLCGRALEQQKTIHASCVDERHENRFEGIAPHGHYNVPIKGPEGQVLGILVFYLSHGHEKNEREVRFLESCSEVMANIILAHNYETKILQAKNIAEDALKTKSLFLATMSHEIRTPLNGLLGCTSLLLDNIKEPENVKMLKTVLSCGDSLLTLINDILDFSKIESQKMTLEDKPFDLKDLVEQVNKLFRSNLYDKPIKITHHFSPEVPQWIRGDITRLRQVLSNLVSNAVKFTPKGKVHTSVSVLKQEEDRFELKFVIEDDGIGIDKLGIDKLFQSFTQVDASTTRKFGGTGLGLAICKALVELMGGSICVDSQKGRGSTFYFTMKAIESLPVAPEINFTVEGGNLAEDYPLSILLVDDNKINQLVGEKLLAKLGYTVDLAVNGIDALKKLEKNIYDMIFMDCLMPEMDGFEATKKIIEIYQDQRPYIVALTANAMEEDKEKCLNSGMDDFIGKPIQLEEVIRSIKTCCAQNSKKIA